MEGESRLEHGLIIKLVNILVVNKLQEPELLRLLSLRKDGTLSLNHICAIWLVRARREAKVCNVPGGGRAMTRLQLLSVIQANTNLCIITEIIRNQCHYSANLAR